MSGVSAALRQATVRWIAEDPHEGDRTELQAVLARAMGGDPDAVADLTDRMSAPLAFGTAGLRGPLRAGPNGMNLAVVRRAASGLGDHLRAGQVSGPIIVGHDARHRSAEFAADVAGVLAAQGFRVLLAPGALPTPVTAFATRALNAAAGIQITASHNPPQDNGMKVYLAGGSQLVSPEDTRIENAIAASRPAIQLEANGRPEQWPADLIDRYLAAAAAVRPAPAAAPAVTAPSDNTAPSDATTAAAPDGPASTGVDPTTTADSADTTPVPGPAAGDAQPSPDVQTTSAQPGAPALRPLRIAATPMHGVGGQSLLTALARAGFTDVHLVAQQAEPDPDFPTVVFPNPEEPGAVDQLLALAQDIDADVAIANDPDADRCAVATRTREGGWRLLTGDEAGLLLGDHVLRHLDRTKHPDPLVATTIVSSQALSAVAKAHGARYDETLTGFKWIVRAGDGNGTGLVFGYEEALGLCVDPTVVRDKDGISAAVLLCDLVDELRSQGRTLLDALDDIARRDGLFVTDQLSVRVSDLSLISDAMARLRRGLPGDLGGDALESATDLMPRTDGIVIRTATARVVIRPSGTEPKLKCYLQVHAEVPDGTEDLTPLRERAQEQLAALKKATAQLVGLS